METLVYNLPRKLFQPYKNISIIHSNSSSNKPIPKPNFPMNINSQPGLLPTSKFLTLPYQNQTKPYTPNSNRNQYPKPNINKNSKILTKKEKDDMRRRGLCMWCGSKYVYGLTCLKSQLYHPLVDENENVDGEQEEFSYCLVYGGNDAERY